MSELVLKKERRTLKFCTVATVVTLAGAVALPQLFHLLGMSMGIGSLAGEVFLPMHLPVIMAGLLAGKGVGAVSGLLAPLVSFLLTGMPGSLMLPFIMAELCAYGFFAGAFAARTEKTTLCVLGAQIMGRAVRSVIVLFAVYVMSVETVAVSTIWKSIRLGLAGILIQLLLIPVVMKLIKRLGNKHSK